MIEEKRLNLERLVLKDAWLFKGEVKDVVGVRIWRGKEWKLFSKKPLANWDSIGHVALKIYSSGQYISFFPKGCNKNLPDEKKHSELERDHLHSEEQDELYGAPDEEFLIKVNDVKAIDKKIRELTEAINKSKSNWFLWSILFLSSNSTHCSHLTHELLIKGGVKIHFLLKNKLIFRFFIYYFIRKFWLWIAAFIILKKLTDNAHCLITWTFRYENRLLEQGYSNLFDRLILSICKSISEYLDGIFNHAEEKGKSWGYICGIFSIASRLTPVIVGLIFVFKNYIILTPEDIYWIGKELDVLKNSNQIISNNRVTSWVYSRVSITDQIAWASVINTAHSNDCSDFMNSVLGHATLVVEALREQIIYLFQKKLAKVNQRITELDKKYTPIESKFKELKNLSESQNMVTYWYRKIRMNGFDTSINERELMKEHKNQLIKLDKLKNKKKEKRNIIEASLKALAEFSPKTRYIAICDIHAKSEELLSLPKSEQNSLINKKGYIDNVQIKQYIFDQIKGVFLIDSRANLIRQNAGPWLDLLNKKIISSRKDERRVYPLGQGAFNQLIINVESQSKRVENLMEAKKYIELPKWQLAGKYHLFSFKDWDGLNCAEWCNDQLYQVGAISKGVATVKAKPPKGIQDLLLNGFSSVFG